MQAGPRLSIKLKNTAYLLLGGCILGPLYTVFSDGFTHLFPYLNALFSGIFVALIIAFYEFVVFSGNLRKLKFYKLLLLRIALYVLSISFIILIVLIASRSIRYDMGLLSVLKSDEFIIYLASKDFKAALLYAFTVVTIANFTMQINRKLGQGVLWGFILGKYHKPKEAARIIMFLKIHYEPMLIEEIGRLSFLKFLNTTIYDITDIILLRKGMIYEYVENEIVISWKLKDGLKNFNCLNTFFEINDKLKTKESSYVEKYSDAPHFTASLHFDKITIGEIGEVKSEIKYHGDAMNTASRILGITSSENTFLVSQKVLNLFESVPPFQTQDCGEFFLKGKVNPVRLFCIEKQPQPELHEI